MATNGASMRVEDTEASLDKIERQLASSSGRNLLQGPLLKQSETLGKWNERWVILDPTTGKMEYKMRRDEPNVKGIIVFDATSSIALSPVNFNGLPKYDGCCIYIGTPQKKDYFLCAETPGAAKAWVSTLHASQLVLKAHKEAVDSLSGSGSAQLGTVATVVAAANSAAVEATREIEAAMKISLRNALGSVVNRSSDGQMDDTTIMKAQFDFDKLEDSCVQITIKMPKFYSVATGSLIHEDGDRKLILTCGHNVDDFFNYPEAEVEFSVTLGGKQLPAYLITSEEYSQLELALLVATYDGSLSCRTLDISCALKVKGMPLYMSSHAYGLEYISNSIGNLSQPKVPGSVINQDKVSSLVEYVIASEEGSSGAAVVDALGRLVAVHTNTERISVHCNENAKDIISDRELTFSGDLKYGISADMVRQMIQTMSSGLDQKAVIDNNDGTGVPNVSLEDRLSYIAYLPPTPKPGKQ